MNKWFVFIPIALSVIFRTFWILLSWILGARVSRVEWAEVVEAERALGSRTVTALKSVADPDRVAESRLVMGNAAISPGFFSRWTAGYKSWFGGELRGMTRSVDLARRMALVRMRQNFPDADAFVNCKVEAAYVEDPRGRGILCVEVSATSTGILYGR